MVTCGRARLASCKQEELTGEDRANAGELELHHSEAPPESRLNRFIPGANRESLLWDGKRGEVRKRSCERLGSSNPRAPFPSVAALAAVRGCWASRLCMAAQNLINAIFFEPTYQIHMNSGHATLKIPLTPVFLPKRMERRMHWREVLQK